MKDNRPVLTIAAVCLAAALIGSGWMLRGCHDAPPKPPVVVVEPAPIPAPGFRVLVLEESGVRTPEMGMLHSPEVEAYIAAKCAKGDDGKTPEYRVLDDDVTPAQQQLWSDLWKVAYEKAKADANGALPWVIVSNGKAGASVPMPKSQSEFMALLKKYGE